MSNVFAPQQNTDSTPFDGDDDDGIEMPDTPVGVLQGHIVEVKKFDDKQTNKLKGYMIVVHCDDPAYAKAQDATIWVAAGEANKLRTIAAALGIMCETNVSNGRTRVVFVDDADNRGLAAFKHKPGLFVYAPYQGAVSLARFGLPRKGDSPEWDQYAEEANFSDDQLAALKKAANGIVPADKLNLFS